MLNISRVCKVVKGGRHVAFRADVVVGNGAGLVLPAFTDCWGGCGQTASLS